MICFCLNFPVNICAIGKKTAQKRLPLIAIGNDWHAAAAALLIGNLL